MDKHQYVLALNPPFGISHRVFAPGDSPNRTDTERSYVLFTHTMCVDTKKTSRLHGVWQ